MVEIEINYTVKCKITKSYFKELAQKTLKVLKIKESIKISLAFISEDEIKKINKKYRQKNNVTDVLSFFAKEARSDFPEEKEYLGEILICYSQAKKQSLKNKQSVKKEIALLFVHGLLHLLGYDHKNRKEEQKMESLQNLILSN